MYTKSLVPGKANIQAQKDFLAEYEALRKQQPAEAPCYFMDATHPLYNPIANYGWIKRGQDYVVKTNTGRRLNINGAMNISMLDPVIRYDDTINADSTIAFFKQSILMSKTFPLSQIMPVTTGLKS